MRVRVVVLVDSILLAGYLVVGQVHKTKDHLKRYLENLKTFLAWRTNGQVKWIQHKLALLKEEMCMQRCN